MFFKKKLSSNNEFNKNDKISLTNEYYKNFYNFIFYSKKLSFSGFSYFINMSITIFLLVIVFTIFIPRNMVLSIINLPIGQRQNVAALLEDKIGTYLILLAIIWGVLMIGYMKFIEYKKEKYLKKVEKCRAMLYHNFGIKKEDDITFIRNHLFD